jgi:DNA polymerase (family 10)
LDYPEDILEEFDIVIASIHIVDDLSLKNVTNRLIGACTNKNVDIIGHPTCRLSKVEYDAVVDIDKVFRAAAENDVALEINCNGMCIDLNEENIAKAKAIGCKFAINTDFHALKHMDLMRLGIDSASRAGLTCGNVINCLSFNELVQWLDD